MSTLETVTVNVPRIGGAEVIEQPGVLDARDLPYSCQTLRASPVVAAVRSQRSARHRQPWQARPSRSNLGVRVRQGSAAGNSTWTTRRSAQITSGKGRT